MTGGVILAAGMSSRMHTYKPLIDIAGKKMIHWTIEHMILGGVECIVVVTGHNNHLLSDYIQAQWTNHVQIAYNPYYSNGKMFDSVQTGLAALRGCDRIFLALADMPAISPLSYIRLGKVFGSTDKKIIIPVVEGRRCHPPLISAEIIDQILDYEGTDGLRGFWRKAAADVLEMELTDPGCTLDADKKEDLLQLEEYLYHKFKKCKSFL